MKMGHVLAKWPPSAFAVRKKLFAFPHYALQNELHELKRIRDVTQQHCCQNFF